MDSDREGSGEVPLLRSRKGKEALSLVPEQEESILFIEDPLLSRPVSSSVSAVDSARKRKRGDTSSVVLPKRRRLIKSGSSFARAGRFDDVPHDAPFQDFMAVLLASISDSEEDDESDADYVDS